MSLWTSLLANTLCLWYNKTVQNICNKFEYRHLHYLYKISKYTFVFLSHSRFLSLSLFQCSGDAVSECWAVRHHQVLVTMATAALLSHLSGFRQSAVVQHLRSSLRDLYSARPPAYDPNNSGWSNTHRTHTHQLSCFIERSLSLHAVQTFIFHRCNFSTFSVSPRVDSEYEGERECREKRKKQDWFLSSVFLQLWPAVCHELRMKLWHIDGERRCTRGSDLSFFTNRFTLFLSHTLQWCFPTDTTQYFSTFIFLHLWYTVGYCMGVVRLLAAPA